MRTYVGAILALMLGCLSSCSPAVNVQQKAGVDFSKYHTYDWAKTEVKSANSQNPIYNSSLNDEMIQGAISKELAQRGIQQVQGKARPDFYLTYHLYIEEAERTIPNPPTPGYAYPYNMMYRGRFMPINYGYWYTSPSYNTGYSTETFNEGTMILDVVDAKSHNLVWRGSMADAVSDPARIGPEFSKSAREILEKFPVAKNQ